MNEAAAPTIEVQLVQQIAQGDQDAFAQLYDHFSGILFSIALNIVRNPKVAEDVLQEVFLQIWKKAATYNAQAGKPLSWAMVLTRNKSIDQLRSLHRRDRLLSDASEQQEVPSQPSTGDHVEKQESAARVHQELLQLPKDQREAIELAFFGGLSQSEIADALNQPLGTIKARIRRGMQKLRDVLQAEP